MAEEGLNQEDFRKLLQTPRPGNGTTTTPKFKAPPPKAPRDSGAVFAKPASVRNKKKKNDDELKNKSAASANYRDRAAERRIEEQNATTTEDLLRPMEEDESLNAQQIYEQSKYLGGDIQHTHLVKGLDYTLLNKVRRQIQVKKKDMNSDEDEDEDDENNDNTQSIVTDEQAEDELDNVLDKLDKGELVAEKKHDIVDDISKLSVTAKSIYNLLIPSSEHNVKVHELFRPGRMAFVFPLATIKGEYEVGKNKRPKFEYTGDPFAMPTAIIRSKAELGDKQQSQSKHSSSGWSDDALHESNLIISKITQVMKRSQSITVNEPSSQNNAKISTSKTTLKTIPVDDVKNVNKEVDDDDDDDDLLFGDVGTDYVLDESTIKKNQESQNDKTSNIKTNYFMDKDEETEEMNKYGDETTPVKDVETPSITSEVKPVTNYSNMIENDRMDKKRKYDHHMGPSLEEGIDADSQDIDMFGLSTSALPTSFEDRQRMYVLDEDEDGDDQEGDDGKNGNKLNTLLIDQGTHKNKKAQLSRWDFDSEEQWQHYKSTIEIQPKSAAQFGVKMGDGRKRNKERRVMTEKQKLNREYQQVKNIMDKKYGKN
ncbi:unnamed protein product [Cunninghamella blakesleeana]